MESFIEYQYAFESCKSFKGTGLESSVSRNDFASICRRFKLNYDKTLDAIGSDGQGRIMLDSLLRYLQRSHPHGAGGGGGPGYYPPRGDEMHARPTSPPPTPARPAPKPPRTYSSHHHKHPVKYVSSPTAHAERDDFPAAESRSTLRQEQTRTPDVNVNYHLSPEADSGRASTRPDRRERTRPVDSDQFPQRSHSSARGALPHERDASPPLPSHTHHSWRHHRADRSEKAKSYKGGDSDDGSENGEYVYVPPPPPHSSSSSHSRKPPCKHCRGLQRQLDEVQESLKATRMENDRLEAVNERMGKELHLIQNTDLAYAQLIRENEKLHQELKKLRKDRSMDAAADRNYMYIDRQYEELKKMKEDLEDEMARDRSVLKTHKKECSALRAQLQSTRVKNEELQRANWKLTDENQKLTVKLMEEDRTRHPGDGGSAEHSGRSNYVSELGFHRTGLRPTYDGKAEVTREPSSKSRKGRGLEMKRTSSAGQALDYNEPVRDDARHDDYYAHRTARSHKSAPSEASDVMFPLVTTTADEQSSVFMVLGEDVCRNVLPEGLPAEKQMAMVYSLQNCHSVQELIKCLTTHGGVSSSDKLHGFQIENDHLKSCVEHLKSKNATLAHSFENAKSNMEAMYHRSLKVDANATRLSHAVKLCLQVVEVFEVLLELRVSDIRINGSNPNYFPSFDYSSLESSTRSPDHREHGPVKHSAILRAKALLHALDSNTELQTYFPGARSRPDYSHHSTHSHWPGTLSQNTGTTSGLSSLSGGIEVDISPGEIDRLKLYTQALLHYQDHLVRTLCKIDGLKALDTVKGGEIVQDCISSEHGGQITDLEDAANSEELCKVREEKAELRSQIFIMEQEKRRMELEVSRMLLHKGKCDRALLELQHQVREERRKRRKDRKGRKTESSLPPHGPHDSSHMSELSLEFQMAMQREKEQSRRYEELFAFLLHHIRDSQDTTEDLMRFVKDLRRANHGLVDAFEKSKKRQQAEKKRMKHELVSYMNRAQLNSGPSAEEPTNGTIFA